VSPEDQRIAIAEACGWQMTEHTNYGPPPYRSKWSRERNPMEGIPDYPNDLNAMNEAVCLLSDEQRFEYGDKLAVLVFGEEFFEEKFSPNGLGYYDIAQATAAQRAEAFLRTIGKWVEAKEGARE